MISVLLVLLLALDLIAHGPLTSVDPAISSWLQQQRTPALTRVLLWVSALHSSWFIHAVSALLVAALLAGRRRRDALALVLTVQGGMLLNVGLKHIFDRPRPHWTHPLLELSSASFPSGHAVAATVFWAYLCVQVGNSRSSSLIKAVFAGLACSLVIVTSFSRVYLGAHYLSDVLAGMAVGIAWICLCRLAMDRIGWRTTLEPGEIRLGPTSGGTPHHYPVSSQPKEQANGSRADSR